MRVIAYLIIRDEEDVLVEVVAHHRCQGLEIVIIDNGSTDGTLELLSRLQAAGERRRGSHLHYDGYLGYAAEALVPSSRLHRKEDAAPWQREMMYERPEALVSEHHDFNATGWFDRSSQRGSEICIKGKMALEEQRVIMEIAGVTYGRIQRKWEQQLRNDLLPR